MKITAHSPFSIYNADGSMRTFGVGVHEVSADEAAHWYVQANSTPEPSGDAAADKSDKGKK